MNSYLPPQSPSKHEQMHLFSLVAKIMLAIIFVLFIFSLILYMRVKNSEQEHFIDLGNYITTQTSEAITDWIEEQVKLASFIAEDSRMIEASADPLDPQKRLAAVSFVNQLHSKFTDQENIGAVTNYATPFYIPSHNQDILIVSDTIFIDSVDGNTLGKRNGFIPRCEYFTDDTPFIISAAYPSILRGNPIIVISVPIKNGDTISGYVFLSPQIDSFASKFLAKAFTNDSGYLFLADERGLIVAHNNPDFVLNSDFAKSANTYSLRDQFLAGEIHAEQTFNDVKKQYYAHEIVFPDGQMDQRLFTLFTQDEKQIFRNARRILFLMLLSLGVSILIILLITYHAVKKSQTSLKKENLIYLNETLRSEVKRRTQQLQDLAEHDALTGCLNHNTIYQVLEAIIHSTSGNDSTFSIALLDLDDFKHVNDTYGHTMGDEVLRKTAQTIQDCIRDNDIAGRYGGEEFLIIMPDTDILQAELVAERIRRRIAENEFRPNDFHITVSIGICTHQSETSLELVNKADQLLYQAKRSGKNQVMKCQ